MGIFSQGEGNNFLWPAYVVFASLLLSFISFPARHANFSIKILQVNAVPIDNGVIGHPEVTCGQHSVRLDVKTKNPFLGRIYVKGEADVPGCSTTTHAEISYDVPPAQSYGTDTETYNPAGYGPSPNPYETKKKSKSKRSADYPNQSNYGSGAYFELPLSHCNMRRARTLYPRGVEYTYVAVVSFHPLFITKVDKAYRIKCFYMEAEKQVQQSLEVAMLTTAGLEQVLPMPVCQYHIKREGYNGNEIRYAKVGDKVTHVWQCSQESLYQYGLLIKNCYVDNGRGKKFQLVDSKGCSVDIHLLPQITYSDKYLQASVHSHVFKFADIPQLHFTCTVQLCVKSDGGCDGVTPPTCYGYPQQGQTYQGGHHQPPQQLAQTYQNAHHQPAPVPIPVPPPPPGYIGPPKVPHYQDLAPPLPQPEPYTGKRAQDYQLDETPVVHDAPPEDIFPNNNSAIRYLNAEEVVKRARRTPTLIDGSGAALSDDRAGRGSATRLEAEITSQALLVLPYEDEILHDEGVSDRLTIVDPSSEMKDISGQMCLTTLGFNIIVAMFALLCALSMVLSGLYLRGYIRSGKRAL